MPRFSPEKTQNLRRQIEVDDGREDKTPEMPNVWDVLKERKKRGLWDGEVTTHTVREFNLRGGEHYYIIENLRIGGVKCVSCPIAHGGILEQHMLHRYEVKNGIIFLDGEAKNKTPDGFDIDNYKG